MKNVLQAFIFYATLWALMYLAFAQRMEGARYVLQLGVWVAAVFAFVLLSDESASSAAAQPLRMWQGALRMLWSTTAWALVGLLVWFGYLGTGLAGVWVVFAAAAFRHKVAAIRSKAAAQAKEPR